MRFISAATVHAREVHALRGSDVAIQIWKRVASMRRSRKVAAVVGAASVAAALVGAAVTGADSGANVDNLSWTAEHANVQYAASVDNLVWTKAPSDRQF